MAAQVAPSVATWAQFAEPPLLRLLFRHTALVRSGANMRSAPLREVLDRSVEGRQCLTFSERGDLQTIKDHLVDRNVRSAVPEVRAGQVFQET